MLDNQMDIAQPTDAVKATFKIENESEPDVTIEDIESREGVYVYGTEPSKIVDIIKKVLPRSVYYKENIGRIYCGIIKNTDQKSKSIVISLADEEEGILDLKNFWGYVKPGMKILVQSKGTYDGKTMLSTQIRLFGEHVIIIKNGFTKMSRGIRSTERRDKLYEIAKSMNLKDWGVLWVQGADSTDEQILRDELAALADKEKEINDRFEKEAGSLILYEGLEKYFVLFGKEDKLHLDDIRKDAMPTIDGHHALKSAGYTILTDLAETMLDKLTNEEVERRMNSILMRYGPIKGKLYKVSFTRLNGTSYKVDGIASDLEVKDEKVRRVELTNRSDWGDRKYIIESDKNYIEIIKGESSEKLLVLKPELFPKFAKIVTFDISAKREKEGLNVVNEERLEHMIKVGEITRELGDELKGVVEEMKRV
jgi:hypothetical protein